MVSKLHGLLVEEEGSWVGLVGMASAYHAKGPWFESHVESFFENDNFNTEKRERKQQKIRIFILYFNLTCNNTGL